MRPTIKLRLYLPYGVWGKAEWDDCLRSKHMKLLKEWNGGFPSEQCVRSVSLWKWPLATPRQAWAIVIVGFPLVCRRATETQRISVICPVWPWKTSSVYFCIVFPVYYNMDITYIMAMSYLGFDSGAWTGLQVCVYHTLVLVRFVLCMYSLIGDEASLGIGISVAGFQDFPVSLINEEKVWKMQLFWHLESIFQMPDHYPAGWMFSSFVIILNCGLVIWSARAGWSCSPEPNTAITHTYLWNKGFSHPNGLMHFY